MKRSCLTCKFRLACLTCLSSRPDNLARSLTGSCRFYKSIKRLPYVKPYIVVERRFF